MMEENKACLPGAPKIYAAIAGVIRDIGVVSKDKVNKQQGYKYRGVDDVYSVLNPALAKNKVFILPEIMDEVREIKTTKNGAQMICVILKMKYTIYAEDGSHIETILKGEAMDTGDKAINKAMAIAYKYLCFQLFCIPVEDMSDPDADSHELADASKKKPAAAAKGQGTAAKKQEPAKEESVPDSSGSEKITEEMVNKIRSEQKRTGVGDKLILTRLHSKAKRIEDMTVGEFDQVMKIFQVTNDRKQEVLDEYK